MSSEQKPVTVQIPAPRVPMPAVAAPVLRGERVIVATADGTFPGYRAWSEVFTDPAGNVYVDVVEERGWWENQLNQVTPRFWRWPVGAVWVE